MSAPPSACHKVFRNVTDLIETDRQDTSLCYYSMIKLLIVEIQNLMKGKSIN